MKLTVTETINSAIEVEEVVTVLQIADFDAAAGAILQSLIQAKGDLIVGTSAGDVDIIPVGNDGDVLTVTSGTWAGASPSGGVANALDFQAALTTTSSDPETFTASSTVVYLTPNNGNKVGIYGSAWERYNLTEISIKLTDIQNGNTTNGSAVVTGLTSTSQFIVGMEVTGTGIAASSTIASIDSATQVTLNNNATADGTGVALTFKVPAGTTKIYLVRIGTTNYLRLSNTATALQDGVFVKDGDATWLYCGAVIVATAGICYGIINQYYTIHNTQGLWRESYFGSFTEWRAYTSAGVEFEPTYRSLENSLYYSGCVMGTSGEAANGDYFTNLIAIKNGTYKFMISAAAGNSYCKFDLYVDGVKVTSTPLDAYASSTNYNANFSVEDISVGYNGVHEFKIVVNGKNASSSGYRFVASSINIFRTS